jgi:hypothetical protein
MIVRLVFSKKEHSDSGLALLLLTLIVGLWHGDILAFKLAVVEVLILLIAPVLVYPFTFVWLNISDLLGKLMSKILLTAIFFVFVFPVAFFRRLKGIDSLRLKRFKKDINSVFTERTHEYTKGDFINPY